MSSKFKATHRTKIVSVNHVVKAICSCSWSSPPSTRLIDAMTAAKGHKAAHAADKEIP